MPVTVHVFREALEVGVGSGGVAVHVQPLGYHRHGGMRVGQEEEVRNEAGGGR